jgi:putative endonuclease
MRNFSFNDYKNYSKDYKNSKTFNKTKGNTAENKALEYLESLGWKILEKNWRFSNMGELDIVALDPNRFNEEYIIFIEVKYRSESELMSLNALNQKKLRQIKKLALIYLKQKKLNPFNCNFSFDFIAVYDGGIRHLKDV